MLSTYALIIVAISSKLTLARDEYTGNIFYRTDSRLVEVPSDIPSEAKEVYLQDNKITDVRTGAFGHLQVCTRLTVYNNSISTIEGNAFTGMARLEVLFLYQNQLTALDKSMFNGLDSLIYLHIEQNQINTIPFGCFSDLNKLLRLYLSHNKLMEISGNMWLGLQSLTVLYLYVNNIAAVNPGDFDNLPKLETLVLHGNRFSTISYNIFNPALYPDTDGHPRNLCLSLSAVECDSRLCWLKQGERLGWITWFAWSTGGPMYPDCVNDQQAWLDIDLNCPEDVECTTYTESQCESKCESTGRPLDEFNADSTCPCKCSCQEFDQSSCAMKCQNEGKHAVLGARDEFDCLTCQCTCPTFNNNTCHNQCELESKAQIPGAKSRFGCDICQCGCLNRDCDTECGDLQYRVKNGDHGCIVGCRCICPDDCEPNCYGCVSKEDSSLTDQSKSETEHTTVTLALSVVGAFIGGAAICGLVILLCLKRKGMKPFKPKQGTQETSTGDANNDGANVPSQRRNAESVQHDEVALGHINEAGPSEDDGITSPYQYQPLS